MVKEELREYMIKLKVDNLQTEETIKAYSRSDALSLLEKKYGNCKIKIINETPVCSKQATDN